MNVLMTPSPMDGKLGPEVKVGKKVKIFLKVGSFKFNKKGKFKEREQIEIRRTSHNIFDGFNNSSKNIVKVATHKEDASKDVEMEKILMKINLKREKDRLRIARMERLDLKRKEWEIRSICNGIVNELMEEMEVVEMKTWVTGIDALVDTLEIDRERFARSAKVMEVEEDWLTEVFSRMMEHKSITVIKESTRMGEEVIEIKGSQVIPRMARQEMTGSVSTGGKKGHLKFYCRAVSKDGRAGSDRKRR